MPKKPSRGKPAAPPRKRKPALGNAVVSGDTLEATAEQVTATDQAVGIVVHGEGTVVPPKEVIDNALRYVAEIETSLLALRDALHGRSGHNAPDKGPFSAAEQDATEADIVEIRHELEAPQPNQEIVKTRLSRLVEKARKAREWVWQKLSKPAETAILEGVKEVVKSEPVQMAAASWFHYAVDGLSALLSKWFGS